MVIDCRSEEFKSNPQRLKVFLDGVEIKQVFYVDTDKGILKTYDVLGDGAPHSSQDLLTSELDRGLREGWEMPPDGVVSKTLRGRTIELLAYE